MKEQYTYFIYNPATKLIKIGVSNNILKRVRALSTSSGIQLELLFYIEANLEEHLHILYNNHRMIGEWFKISKKEVHSNFHKDVKRYLTIKQLKTGPRILRKHVGCNTQYLQRTVRKIIRDCGGIND